MAVECLKHCCKKVLGQHWEPETQVIKVKPLPANTTTRDSQYSQKGFGGSEDYLVSKLPPDGRDIPFVLPQFRPSFIQPSSRHYPSHQDGLLSSTRRTYEERKAELSWMRHVVYNPKFAPNRTSMDNLVSPGAARRAVPHSTADWEVNDGNARLSRSMLDLSSPQYLMQSYDSSSSVQSGVSSVRDSPGSSRSLDSVLLSGDESETGKLCVRVCYHVTVEQVWITLVQLKDMCVHADGGEQKISIKGTITVVKPVQFKSSMKPLSPEMEFMETFVFALSVEKLRSASLLLCVRTHTPRKRTLGECVLSLHQLGPQESQHWLNISVTSRTSKCQAELHIGLCFQPVSARIQLHVLGAKNIPMSSTPLTQSYFVRAEMHSLGRIVNKTKTRALRSSGGLVGWSEIFPFPLETQNYSYSFTLKLYSRSSVRRKYLLGQVHLGFESPCTYAVQQWSETMAHPEKTVTAWYRLSGR